MANVQDLKDYVQIAENNRVFAQNTAFGYIAAIKMYEEILSQDEKDSLDLIKQRFDKIKDQVFNHRKNDMKLGSLDTYAKRFIRIINDYIESGGDPSKREARRTRSKESSIINKRDKKILPTQSTATALPQFSENNIHNVTLSLRPGKLFTITVPYDITQGEAEVLKAILDELPLKKRSDEQTRT